MNDWIGCRRRGSGQMPGRGEWTVQEIDKDIYAEMRDFVDEIGGIWYEAGFVRRGRGAGAGAVFGNSRLVELEGGVIGRRDARELD